MELAGRVPPTIIEEDTEIGHSEILGEKLSP
jgi:hypothetical protein